MVSSGRLALEFQIGEKIALFPMAAVSAEDVAKSGAAIWVERDGRLSRRRGAKRPRRAPRLALGTTGQGVVRALVPACCCRQIAGTSGASYETKNPKDEPRYLIPPRDLRVDLL